MEEAEIKVASSNTPEEESQKTQKMSYEQLEQVAHQLSEQTRQLYSQLQQVNLNNMFKRLDYLFRVVENFRHFDTKFVTKCVNEIKELLTVPEDTEENTESKGE